MPGGREPLPQRLAERVVLHHIAERFLPLLAPVESDAAEMALVRYFDAVYRTWRGAEFVPYLERLENLARTPGQGSRAGVESIVFAPRNDGFDDQHRTFRTRRRERETRAGEAAADHHDGTFVPSSGNRHGELQAAAIKASISSMPRGTSSLRLRLPFSVTSTSSSMRTPMPRQRGATSSLSGAM